MEVVVNKELIFAHFSRRSSPLQRELIAQWLRHTANEEQYYEWLEEWENRYPQFVAQSQRAADEFTAFLNAQSPTEQDTSHDTLPVLNRSENRFLPRWLIAASLFLLAGLGAVLFRQQIAFQTYQTAFRETRNIQLADGSRVVLRANSNLRVPRWRFGRDTREVFLRGTATFSVTHLPDAQEFIVKTDHRVDVVVLGTEFTVFSRKRGASVLLSKGKVRLHYREGNAIRQVTMKPGDLATLDAKNHIALKGGQPPQPPVPSQDNQFVFNETTLREVAYRLEENYGLEVEIKSPALANRILMGSFRADNVDQLLQAIAELLEINVVRQGDQVQISDHG